MYPLKIKKLNLVVYLGRCWREWNSKLQKNDLKFIPSRISLATLKLPKLKPEARANK